MTVTIPGLSAAQAETYVQGLRGHCEVRHQVLTLDLSHNLITSVEAVSLDGQINIVDGGGDGITRTLQMGFFDPDHALQLDAGDPSSGFGGLERLVQVNTFVRAPGWATWLGAPSYTGRPSVVGRDGYTVTVEAQDKACLHLKGVSAYTIPKRTNTVAAIKSILERNGETRFRFPVGVTDRMPGGKHVGGPDEDRQPWKVAHKLAQSIGYQLYYDVLGYACLRRPPTEYAWELYEHGNLANTLTRVKMTTDLTRIRNKVVVTGHTKPTRRGQRSRVLTGTAVPPATHPLSRESLAVNGKPGEMVAFFDEPDIHTQAQVNAFAKARLDELLEEEIAVETTTYPVWHLEAKDLMRLQTSTGSGVQFRLLDASIPLGESETGMTIGYQARVRTSSAGRLRRSV